MKHALIRYSEAEYRMACLGLREVVDAAGRPVDLEGALEEDVRFYLR